MGFWSAVFLGPALQGYLSGLTLRADTEVDAAARVPCWLVEIDQPRCSLSYTSAPCTAVDAGNGSRCWYTYHTCQDRANYTATTRTWRFTTHPTPPTLASAYAQVWPIISSVSSVSQQIDPDSSFTRTDRMTITLLEVGRGSSGVADDDAVPIFDVDKTLHNTSRDGLFWRRLTTMWPNFGGAAVRIKRGFYTSTFTESDFETVWTGTIEDVKFTDGGDVQIKAVDLLREPLDKKIPTGVSGNNKITSAYSRSATSIVVTNGSELTVPSTIDGDVVISVTNADTARTEYMIVTNVTGNTLTVTRAAFGTVAEPIAANTAFKEVIVYANSTGDGGLSPETIALDILNRIGVPAASINTGSISRACAWSSGMRLKRVITEPTEGRKLLFELGEHMATACWYVDETQSVALCQVNAGAYPNEYAASSYTALARSVTDSKILLGSGTPNLADTSRLTHVEVLFDPTDDAGQDATDTGDFNSRMVAINGETYTSSYYGSDIEDKREKKIASKWIESGNFPMARCIATRWSNTHGHAPRTLTIRLELRDRDYRLGDLVEVTTNAIQSATGATDTLRMRIVKKQWDDKHGLSLTLREVRAAAFSSTTAASDGHRLHAVISIAAAPDIGGASFEDLRYAYITAASKAANGRYYMF